MLPSKLDITHPHHLPWFGWVLSGKTEDRKRDYNLLKELYVWTFIMQCECRAICTYYLNYRWQINVCVTIIRAMMVTETDGFCSFVFEQTNAVVQTALRWSDGWTSAQSIVTISGVDIHKDIDLITAGIVWHGDSEALILSETKWLVFFEL